MNNKYAKNAALEKLTKRSQEHKEAEEVAQQIFLFDNNSFL